MGHYHRLTLMEREQNKGVGSLFSPPAITDDLSAALDQAR